MSLQKINDYDLLEIIGTGSYSTVHRARNKENKQYFAIKCVSKTNLSSSSTENLLREIKLLKTLKHEYIVEMIDFRWDEKNIYIIMELCNAGNLSTYIKRHSTLPETTCKFFMRQLAFALQYMRSNNISHFDLKPHNLLLTKSPNLKLKVADFGFAQYLNLNQENTVIKGSPLYMAPEILLKHSYTASADLWSIGVILYECIFGNAPYSSKSLDELLKKIKNQQKIIISPYAKISMECRDIMGRLLMDDPDKRITFQEFFEHPFIDLNHVPNDKNLVKAIQIVTKAVEEDQKQNYKEAYHLYCDGLQYFIPLISAENDIERQKDLQNRALSYLNRAEEIKTSLKQYYLAQRDCNSMQQVIEQSDSNGSSSNSGNSVSIKTALIPKSTFCDLYKMFSSSPSIQSALDIGRQAELYSYERKFSSAFELFTSALNVLVPSIRKEPSGERRDLLQQQVMDWMREAECMKSLLTANSLKKNKNAHQNCVIQ